jgi:CHAD domain-containing protein
VAKAKPIKNIDCRDAAVNVIPKVLLACLKRMCALRSRAEDWNDLEGVHEMRVASRRLRSALSDFQPYLRKDSIPSQRLKAIARSLGAVRDEDVVIAALEKLRSHAEGKIADGIEAIAAEHRRQRRQARALLEPAIRHLALTELSTDFRSRLSSGMKSTRATGKTNHQSLSFAQAGSRIIGRRLKRLIKASDAFHDPLRTRKLHELRILTKRLRYAVELFAPCAGTEFKQVAKEIARLQTSLGELHDCDVWIANLGARLNKEEALDDGAEQRSRDAVVWLLQHFVSERARHYCAALSRWDNWESRGFLDRFRGMLSRV